MAAHRIKEEGLARMLVLLLALGVAAAALAARVVDRTVEVHAAMPERGGWMPDSLTASAGEPLTLRLISDDVVHGFAIGQSDQPAVDVLPGKPTEVTLTFDRPGTYTYYCTRWCGPNHWRMRGTITVEGEDPESMVEPSSPLYVTLGMDLDAPHQVPIELPRKPSARRGQALGIDLPAEMLNPDYVRAHSPYDAWQALQRRLEISPVDDADIWDLVAFLWVTNTTPEALQAGEQLYAQNCAACHGVTGGGDGIFAAAAGETAPAFLQPPEFGHEIVLPTEFTESSHMLGANTALLQGKIIRGGMGTGMPSWGLIFTEEQTWELSDYLWTFIFDYEE